MFGKKDKSSKKDAKVEKSKPLGGSSPKIPSLPPPSQQPVRRLVRCKDPLLALTLP